MSTIASTIETRFTASIIDFEKQVQKMAATNERAAKRIEQQALKSSTAMASAWKKNDFSSAIKAQASEVDGLVASFTRLAPAIAAAMSIQGGLSLIEHYTELSNSMKLAGVSAEDFAKVQKQLANIANDAGVPINALADLLRSVSQANGDLGLSQSQVIDLTKSVSLGLKVSGTSAAAASGALLQLGQALESGKVHAQEFNSINMAIHPLLVAAAQASEKYGGSVAKMKEDVDKGGLSSKEFARLLLAGQQTLEAQTGKMATTQSQAMAKLQNAMILYAGQVDQNLGVSEKFVAVIELIAQNIDVLVAAVAVGATVIGARMVAAMAAYTISTVASTAGTFAFAAAMKGIPVSAAAAEVSLLGLKAAGSAVLGIFGGPIGLAITGVTLAVGYLVSEHEKADKATKEFNATIAEYTKRQDEAADAAAISKAVESGHAAEIPDHIKKIAALTGQVADLANQWAVVAAQAKEARLQQLQAMLTDNVKVYREAEKRHKDAVRNDEIATNMTRGGWGEDAVLGDRNAAPVVSKAQIDAKNALAVAKAENDSINTQIYKTTHERLVPLRSEGGTPKTKGSKGTDQTDKALKEAAQIQLAVALADAKTEEQRHKIRLQGLKDDLDREVAETEKSKNIKADAKETLIQAKNAKYLSDVSEENKKYAEFQKQQEKAINDATNSLLGKKLSLATTAQEQHDLALKQLEYAHNEALAAIDANETYTAETKVRLKIIEQENYTLDIATENKTFAQKLLDEKKNQFDIEQRLIQFQIDALKSEAELAKTRKEREALNAQALALQQKTDLEAKRRELEDQVQAHKNDSSTGMTEDQADSEMAAFQKGQAYERQKQAKDNGSPLDKYYDEISNFDDAYSNVVVNGLKTIEDSISGLVDGTKTWGDVFRSVAASVVSDILKIIVKQTLIKPIAKLLGAGDSNDTSSNWTLKAKDFQTYSSNSTGKTSAASIITDAAQLGKMFGIPGFAKGVENFGGGLAITGEDGPELLNLPSGTSVKNAAQTRSLLNPFKGNASPKAAGTTVHQYFNSTINADGVKTTQDIQGWIAQSAQQTAQQARDAAISGMQKKNRNRF